VIVVEAHFTLGLFHHGFELPDRFAQLALPLTRGFEILLDRLPLLTIELSRVDFPLQDGDLIAPDTVFQQAL
jgi:hypothetical protein